MSSGRYIQASGVGLLCVCLSACTLGTNKAEALRVHARDAFAANRLNAEGLALVEQGAFAQAEEHFRKALDADPWHGAAHCNLGVALLKQGKPYNAVWQLQYASRLMPRAAQPWANLGILYEITGRYGLAEEQLSAALSLSPGDIEIVGQLARLHVRQDKHTENTFAWLQSVATQDADADWRRWARLELIRNENANPILEER